MRTNITLGIAVLGSLMAACGQRQTATSALHDADRVTIRISQDLRPEVEAMVATLAAGTRGGPVGLADLTRIVRIAPADAGVFAAAYPAPFAVTCAGVVCSAQGQGRRATVATLSETPRLAGVSLGVRTLVKTRFRVDADARAATVCGIEGVYLQKLILRKSLTAFHADLDTGKVEVWLADAADAPTCDATF